MNALQLCLKSLQKAEDAFTINKARLYKAKNCV